jgi:hypothetical protein
LVLAAKRHKNAAHGASRGESAEIGELHGAKDLFSHSFQRRGKWFRISEGRRWQ